MEVKRGFKAWYWGLLLPVVLAALGGGYWWAVNRSIPLQEALDIPGESQKISGYTPKIVIVSKIPGITFKAVDEADTLLLSWLQRFGYTEPLDFGAHLETGYYFRAAKASCGVTTGMPA